MCFSLLRNQGCPIKDSLDSCNLVIIDASTDNNDISFIIDSGATDSYIDTSYANNSISIKAFKDSSKKVIAPGANVNITSTVDFEFLINNKKYEHSFNVIDLKEQIDFLNEQYDLNKNVCGVIGNDFLKENKVIINYKTNKVIL